MSRAPAQRDVKEATAFAKEHTADRDKFFKIHEAMGLEYNYNFKLKHHHQIDTTKGTRQQRLHVSSLDLYDITRYGAAQLNGTSVYIDVQPVEPPSDHSDAAEQDLEDACLAMKAALDDQIHDVRLGYMDVRRRVVKLARGARAGAIKLDVIPTRTGADIVPKVKDPRNLTWDSHYLHFNQYGCPYVEERIERVSLKWLRANPDYEHTDLVQPDDGQKLYPPRAQPTTDENADHEPYCTLVERWIIEDDEEIEAEVDGPDVLEPEKWYMACGTCGYSERDLRDHPGYDGGTLPEAMPCPKCGRTPEGYPISFMHRIEVETPVGSLPAHEERHRRVVYAPFSPNAAFLQDGPWPKGLTGFPYGMLVLDPLPLEPTGNSDTFLNQDLQSLKNASIVDGFQQMQRNRDLLLVKEDALWDAAHEPYQFDGTGDYVAYTGDYDALRGIQHFQGSGLNPSFGLWMETITTELAKFRGIGEASLSPEQMKGVQVGTMARSIETGDVPLDEQIRILKEFEELLWNRWCELIAGNWDQAKWQQVTGPDGTTAFRSFTGTDMPLLKVRAHGGPELNASDIEQMKAISDLAQIQSPTVLRFAAQRAKLPRKVIDGMVSELMAAKAPPAAPPGGMPGGPPGGPPAPAGMPPTAMSGMGRN